MQIWWSTVRSARTLSHVTSPPIRVIILNDFEVVVRGLAGILEPFSDRVVIVELDVHVAASEDADVVLYDTFGAAQGEAIDAARILEDYRSQHLIVYSWNLNDALTQASLARGVSGYLSKQLGAEDLVAAIEQVVRGETVISPEPADGSVEEPASGDWPGRAEGLSEREAEVLAYVVQGLSNQELADRAYLSINTVKTYIRSAYRKMGVSSRSQAVLWGVDHGFRLVAKRIRPDTPE